MKKRILAFFLAVAMCALLCACGAEESTVSTVKEPSLKEKAVASVESKVRSKLSDRGYDISGGVLCKTAAVTEVEENEEFEVSGTVFIKDKYGKYTSTIYDGTVFFNDDGAVDSAIVNVSVPH